MTDSKYSLLPPAALLTGAEIFAVDQAGNSVRTTVSAIGNNALGIYTAPGIGAQAQTVSAKLAQVVSVFDFMTAAQQNDVSLRIASIDVTAACQAAHDSFGVNGGTLFWPAGIYSISSINITKPCVLLGVGQFSGSTLIKPSGTNLNVFNVTSTGTLFRDIGFNPFGTIQTGGSFIKFASTSSIGRVEECQMNGWFIGIWLAGISDFTIRHIRLADGVAVNGVGVKVDSGISMTLDTVVCTNSAAARPFAGIQITLCGDITMMACQWIQCVNGCYISPGAAQVCASVYAVNTFFDNCGNYGLIIQPQNASGTVQRVRFTQSWFSSCGTSGILLDAATFGGAIDGVGFYCSHIFLNGSHGVNLVGGANCKDVKFLGGDISGNAGNGILVNANISNFDIIGVTIGPSNSLAGNTANGIQILAGTSNNFVISNNRLNGNTVAAIADGSSGAGRRKVDNGGYNPVGTTAITVTASPFTYTAGDSPETVYINGGTVSLVNIGGLNVFAQTNCSARVGPGTTVVVTYSALPALATSKD